MLRIVFRRNDAECLGSVFIRFINPRKLVRSGAMVDDFKGVGVPRRHEKSSDGLIVTAGINGFYGGVGGISRAYVDLSGQRGRNVIMEGSSGFWKVVGIQTWYGGRLQIKQFRGSIEYVRTIVGGEWFGGSRPWRATVSRIMLEIGDAVISFLIAGERGIVRGATT